MRQTVEWLTDIQRETLAAAMERIVPPDEAAPGAWSAGAGDYLLRQFGRDLADAAPVYRLGLDGLDTEAKARHGQSFTSLEARAQDALLARVEKGEVTADWLVPPSRFFSLLVRHTMEGYYADPGNGGNHDGISWRLIGFEVRG